MTNKDIEIELCKLTEKTMYERDFSYSGKFIGMGFGLYFLYLFGGTFLSMIYEFFTTDSASNVRASAFWIIIFLAAIFGAC